MSSEETKIRNLAFVETVYAVRQFASIDIDQLLSVMERGELGDETLDVLKTYNHHAGRPFTAVALVLASWAILLGPELYGSPDNAYEPDHSLSGMELQLKKGLADYLMSNEVDFEADHRDDRYFPPYFANWVITPLSRIEDGLSYSGRNIRDYFAKAHDGYYLENLGSP